MPHGPDLSLKGITLAIADGISTSDMSHIAAETAVKALLSDYYATPESWTVKTAASAVIRATNSWLFAKTCGTLSADVDKGYVSTLAVLILKARSAHLFHVGDSRIWRLSGCTLEPLTKDHTSLGMLASALGARQDTEITYSNLLLTEGDVFLLTTDGVHEYWNPAEVASDLKRGDIQKVAQTIVTKAMEAGSPDNLTVQIARIESLPDNAVPDFDESSPLPFLSDPKVGDVIDGFTLLRELHGNHRSRLFLARTADQDLVAFKVPGSETREDSEQLQRFAIEEWIARRVRNPHLLSAPPPATPTRTALYSVTEYIDGQTLRQWMQDNPTPQLEQVRDIIEQVVKGLRALHRREMLHQDVRPENIMITRDGVVKIIDFGAAYVAGVQETKPFGQEDGVLGTYQYSAPEYFSNDDVSFRSDMFSLAVIAYEMLTGYLPYGTQVARIRSPKDRMGLRYRPARDDKNAIPLWIDETLQRALHPDPFRRFDSLSEFMADLRRPSLKYQRRTARPLIERDPLRFWQALCLLLASLCVFLIVKLNA